MLSSIPVPHLTTATSKPLLFLEQAILDKQIQVETWLRRQFQATPAPITSSVDLRNAGFKLSPVDTNLFPAGFNNLNPDFLPLCIQAMQTTICESLIGCIKVLLVPENHTRNSFYLQSLSVLNTILNKAGFETRIGSLDPELTEPKTFETPSGDSLIFEPIKREGNRLSVGNFSPCLILLNNDLSSGTPDILQNLEQVVCPTSQLGWDQRLKSNHFTHYQAIVKEFSNLLEIDPWLLSPYFDVCDVDFKNQTGQEELAKKVDELISRIQDKYKEHQIDRTPFVVVKANSGTYGMGIMMVHSGEELLQLNRKQRNKMAASKGNLKITSVILQEGVYTFESWQQDDKIAEPVVYMIGHFVVGGFYRVHQAKSDSDNLNAPGMHFEPLAFAEACNNPDTKLAPTETPNRFYAYGVIARLACLAAAREVYESEQGEQA